MKKLYSLLVFFIFSVCLFSQTTIEGDLQLGVYPLISNADSVLVTNGTRKIGYAPKNLFQQELDLAGTILSISNGNSIDFSGIINTSVWGSITGTLANQIDLQNALDAKNDFLISGTNIRTINGQSLLGSGDIVVSVPNYFAGDGLDFAAETFSVTDPVTAADRIILNSVTDSLSNVLHKTGDETKTGELRVVTSNGGLDSEFFIGEDGFSIERDAGGGAHKRIRIRTDTGGWDFDVRNPNDGLIYNGFELRDYPENLNNARLHVNGRVSGDDAVQDNEYTTKQQMDAAVAGGVGGSMTAEEIRDELQTLTSTDRLNVLSVKQAYPHLSTFENSGSLDDYVADGIVQVAPGSVTGEPTGSDSGGNKDILESINYNSGEIISQVYHDIENEKMFKRYKIGAAAFSSWIEIAEASGANFMTLDTNQDVNSDKTFVNGANWIMNSPDNTKQVVLSATNTDFYIHPLSGNPLTYNFINDQFTHKGNVFGENDFVTGGNLTNEILTLDISNQSSVPFDLSDFAKDTDLVGYLPLLGGTMGGNINMDGSDIININQWVLDDGGDANLAAWGSSGAGYHIEAGRDANNPIRLDFNYDRSFHIVSDGLFLDNLAPVSTEMLVINSAGEVTSQEIPSGGGGVTNHTLINGGQLVDDYTILATDFDSGVTELWYGGATDIEINLATDVATAGEKVFISQYGAGKVAVNYGAGVTGQPFQTIDASGITALRKRFNNEYHGEGNAEDYSGCNANEQNTIANASSSCNEANDTAGWSIENGTPSITSIIDGTDGTYAIQIKNTNTSSASASFEFNATAGDEFDVVWDAKKTTGTYSYAHGWLNCTGGPSFDGVTTSWATQYDGGTNPYHITVTATGTVSIRFWSSTAGGATTNDDYLVDNLRITKTN